MEKKQLGVMLDCSRNGVMNPKQVKEFIDILAKIGYNFLELYTEDTYEVEGEPYFGYLRGRYTAKEIRAIDEYASSKGIELIPCIQTLAHLGALKKNVPLIPLFDVEDVLLCDNERTYEFIDRCFQSIARNFTSRKINIGMDEAHMCGLGKYLKEHGYQDRTEIIFKHLKRVQQIASKYGFKPHMWSDMFFRPVTKGEYCVKNVRLPVEIKERIPKDVSLIYWDYLSTDKEIYDDMLTAHLETGNETWFAGAIWTCLGFAPFNEYTQKRMKIALQSAREHNINNIMMTMWGDNGKECSFLAGLPSLYAIKQYSEGVFDDETIKKGFYDTFKIPFDSFMILDLPNNTGSPEWNGTGWMENPCKCLFYQDAFLGVYDEDYRENGVMPYADYAKRIAEAGKNAGEYKYIFDNVSNLCSFLSVKSDIGIRTRDAYRAKDRVELKKLVKDYDKTIKLLDEFYKTFYYLWHKENKVFGWEVSDLRIGGVSRRLAYCRNKLKDYVKGKLNIIEELEEDILSTGKTDMLEGRFDYITTRSNLN